MVPDVLDADHALVLGELHDLLVALLRGDERVLLELAEAPREREVVLRADVLIAEEDHLELVEGAPDLGEGRVV